MTILPRIAPRYTALVGVDYVESDDSLETLIGVILGLVDPIVGEDVVLWCCMKTVAAIVQADGSVIRLEKDHAA